MIAAGQVVLFVAGARVYGLALDSVRKIMVESDVTPIPRAPSGVVGATLFEGQAAPVFTLDAESKAINGERLIIMTQCGTDAMGILVDNVLRVASSEDEEIVNGIDLGLLEGMPFKIITPEELIASGLNGPGGGKNGEKNPAGR